MFHNTYRLIVIAQNQLIRLYISEDCSTGYIMALYHTKLPIPHITALKLMLPPAVYGSFITMYTSFKGIKTQHRCYIVYRKSALPYLTLS